MRRRLGLAALCGAISCVLVVPLARAQEAPPGSAEAVAAEIDELLAVAHTTAEATSDSATAEANALELGGNPVVGGRQEGAGEKTGAILDTGTTPLGRLALAPWQATASTDEERRAADSFAALLRVVLIDPATIALDVLQSEAHAEHTATRSSGNGSSDVAVLNALDALHLVLLHSESSSDGTGSSYLLGINDQQIGTSDDLAGGCGLDLAPLATLVCLATSGGEGEGDGEGDGTTSGATDAVDLDLLDGALPVNVASIDASSGTGTGTAAGPETSRSGTAPLARTGVQVALLLTVGAALVGGGAVLLRRSRRLTAATPS